MKKPIDPLTGLITSAELHNDMEEYIKIEMEFSLISLDIDNLMLVNEKFGYDAGDEIFRLIARQIKGLFGNLCTAYRGTRDHFDILLPVTAKEDAFLKAETLRRRVCEEKLNHASDGTALTQSISLGVSSYPEDGTRPADITRRAESAMIRAKKNGRNQVCLAREEKLTPKTSHYNQTQLEGLTIVSKKIKVNEAALLREALDDLLKKYDVDDR
jgi:diguanylate cyclase (GGDEF)-like protein